MLTAPTASSKTWAILLTLLLLFGGALGVMGSSALEEASGSPSSEVVDHVVVNRAPGLRRACRSAETAQAHFPRAARLHAPSRLWRSRYRAEGWTLPLRL